MNSISKRTLSKSIVIFVMFFNITIALHAGTAGVEVVAPGPMLVIPRSFITLAFGIKNTGLEKKTFNLFLDLPAGWKTLNSLKPIEIGPGNTKKKLVTLQVPVDAIAVIEYTVRFTASCSTNPVCKSSDSTKIRVKEVYGLKLDVVDSEEQAWPGETVLYQFIVLNLGNSTSDFRINFFSSHNWKIKSSDESVTLLPLQEKTVTAALTVPADITGRSLQKMTLKVTSLTARERGETVTGDINVWLETLPSAPRRSSIYKTLHGDIRTKFDHVGKGDRYDATVGLQLNGDLYEKCNIDLMYAGYYYLDQYNNETRDQDYKLDIGWEKWDVSLGNTSAFFTPLTDYLYGEGAKMRYRGEDIECQFFGATENPERNESDAVGNEFGGDIYFKLGTQNRLGLTVVRTADNTRLYSFLVQQKITENWVLSAEVATSETEGNGRKMFDSAWQAASVLNLTNFYMYAEYYRTGGDFNTSLRNREGYRVYSGYNPWSLLSISFDHSHDSNNFDNDSNKMFSSDLYQLGLSCFPARYLPRITLIGEMQDDEIDERFFITDRSRRVTRIQLDQTFRNITLSGFGEWGKIVDYQQDVQWDSSRYYTAVSGNFGILKGRFGYSRQYDNADEINASAITEQKEIELVLGLFSDRLIPSLKYIREEWFDENSWSSEREHRASLLSGLSLNFFRQQSMDFEVEARNFESDNPEWRCSLLWGMKFNVPVPFIKEKSRISGLIFLDRNSNGQFDAGETVFPKIKVSLGDLEIFSNRNGVFEFPTLLPGPYTLDVDTSRIPVDLGLNISMPHKLFLLKGDEKFVLVPLVHVGYVSGYVFDDQNQNQIMDQEEKGLFPVRIILKQNGGEFCETFTNKNGSYKFTDLNPGDYLIMIDLKYLPYRFIMTTPASVPLSVDLENTTIQTDFGAYLQPQKIKMTFFKSSAEPADLPVER